jgi:RNA polymerase sigma-70 factor (ECF subfamily)
MRDAIEVEAELEQLLRSGALAPAATRAWEAYGRELYGFLAGVLGNDTDAQEVFSEVAEDFWRGLPSFGLRCTVRTWLYVLARHAVTRFRRTPWNKAGRRSGDEQLDALVALARTQTQPWLRTDVKDQWRALRDSLDADDRALLVLRVDQNLEWKDVARVTLGSEAPDDAALSREADRLKKRFQLLKRDLRRRAKAAGLLAE